jgi:hypothetical protein
VTICVIYMPYIICTLWSICVWPSLYVVIINMYVFKTLSGLIIISICEVSGNIASASFNCINCRRFFHCLDILIQFPTVVEIIFVSDGIIKGIKIITVRLTLLYEIDICMFWFFINMVCWSSKCSWYYMYHFLAT